MNHIIKKCFAVFCIWLIISLTFVTSISIAPISAEEKNKIKDFTDVIPNAAAQDGRIGCCVKTFDGDFCRPDTNESDCEMSWGFEEQASCNVIYACKTGVCVESDGSCVLGKTGAECDAAGGSLDTAHSLSAVANNLCSPGCCVYRAESDTNSKKIFSERKNYLGKCYKKADMLGLYVTAYAGMNAVTCREQISAPDVGYCCALPLLGQSFYGATSTECAAKAGYNYQGSAKCTDCINAEAESHCYQGDLWYYDECGAKTGIADECITGREICYEDESGARCKDATCTIKLSATTLAYDTAWLKAGEIGVSYPGNLNEKQRAGHEIRLTPDQTACVQYQGPGERHYTYRCNSNGNVSRILPFGLDPGRETICYYNTYTDIATAKKNAYDQCGQCEDEEGRGPLRDILESEPLKGLIEYTGALMAQPRWWDYRVNLEGLSIFGAGLPGFRGLNPGLCDKDSTCQSMGDCLKLDNNDCVPKFAPRNDPNNAARVMCESCSTTLASSPYNKCTKEGCMSRGSCGYSVAEFDWPLTTVMCIAESTGETLMVTGIKEGVKKVAQASGIEKALRESNENEEQTDAAGNAVPPKRSWLQRQWDGFKNVKILGVRVGGTIASGINLVLNFGAGFVKVMLYPFTKSAEYLRKKGVSGDFTEFANNFIADYFGMRTKEEISVKEFEDANRKLVNKLAALTGPEKTKLSNYLKNKDRVNALLGRIGTMTLEEQNFLKENSLPSGVTIDAAGAISKGGTVLIASTDSDLKNFNKYLPAYTEFSKNNAALIKARDDAADANKDAAKKFSDKLDSEIDKAAAEEWGADNRVQELKQSFESLQLGTEKTTIESSLSEIDAQISAKQAARVTAVGEEYDRLVTEINKLETHRLIKVELDDILKAKKADLHETFDPYTTDPSQSTFLRSSIPEGAQSKFDEYKAAYAALRSKEADMSKAAGDAAVAARAAQGLPSVYGEQFYEGVGEVEKLNRKELTDALHEWWKSYFSWDHFWNTLADMLKNLGIRMVLDYIFDHVLGIDITKWTNMLNPIYWVKGGLCALYTWTFYAPAVDMNYPLAVKKCADDTWMMPILMCVIQTAADSGASSQGVCYPASPNDLSPYSGYSHCSDCNADPNRICDSVRCYALSKQGSEGCTYENGICKPNLDAVKACDDTSNVLDNITDVKDDSGSLAYDSDKNIWLRGGVTFGARTRTITIETEKYSDCKYSTDKTAVFEDMTLIEARDVNGKLHNLTMSINSSTASKLNFSYYVNCQDACTNRTVGITEIKVEKMSVSDVDTPAILTPIYLTPDNFGKRAYTTGIKLEGEQDGKTDVIVEVSTNKNAACYYSRFRMAEGFKGFEETIDSMINDVNNAVVTRGFSFDYIKHLPIEEKQQTINDLGPQILKALEIPQIEMSRPVLNSNKTHSTNLESLNNTDIYAFLIRCNDSLHQLSEPAIITFTVSEWFNVTIAAPKGSFDYQNADIIVTTDRPAKCRYAMDANKNYYGIDDKNSLMDYSQEGFITTHESMLPELNRSRHSLTVSCIDEFDNVATAKGEFEILVDRNPPQITRIYRKTAGAADNLVIVTSEPSTCKYALSPSSYSSGAAKAMDSTNGIEHTTAWQAKTFYIYCKDLAGLQLSPQEVKINPFSVETGIFVSISGSRYAQWPPGFQGTL
jgi:hypothetical protein